jgi:hypothetical protein
MRMITTKQVSAVFVAGLLVLAGCGKSDKNASQAGTGGMDLVKFTQAFPSPTAEQQQELAKVTSGIRYRLYPDAMAALEKLSGDATLTDPQKQAVADLMKGVEKVMTNAPAAPTQ